MNIKIPPINLLLDVGPKAQKRYLKNAKGKKVKTFDIVVAFN